MEYEIVNQDNELYHYGVPGMKWGVRRNLRVLSNNRRNNEIHAAKVNYKKGNITKTEKKAAIKQANKNRNQLYKNMKADLKNASSRAERKVKMSELKKTTIKEVPHSKLKKGLNVARHLLTSATVAGSTATGIGAAGVALGSATAFAAPIAGMAIGSAAVASAAALGLSYVGGKITDRIS